MYMEAGQERTLSIGPIGKATHTFGASQSAAFFQRSF